MNVAKAAQEYISEHPSIKDCVRKGLVNYSALAREICRERRLNQFNAVLIACQRYAKRVSQQATVEKRILSLLKRAKMQIVNKIGVVIFDKFKDFERLVALQRSIKREGGVCNIVDGNSGVVVICSSEYVEDLLGSFGARVRKSCSDVVQISMTFDERIENTPGVVSHIYGLLAEHNINVLEEMSCWTDLMLVISEEDLPRALKVLSFK